VNHKFFHGGVQQQLLLCGIRDLLVLGHEELAGEGDFFRHEPSPSGSSLAVFTIAEAYASSNSGWSKT